jgi:transcriptional regulator with XRE-family HTH domain
MDDATFGQKLRTWRRRRRLSQEALAGAAGVSTRHLSFLETGRARPSRDMVLRLADRLEVPLRERNPMLESAGHAACYGGRPLDAPELAAARRSLDLLLRSHLPHPALAFDRAYELVAANEAVALLTEGVAPELLAPPVNVLKLSLHPRGLAPRIVNFGQWRRHILTRLQRQRDATGDETLLGLIETVGSYPQSDRRDEPCVLHEQPGVLLPLQLRSAAGTLTFVSTVTVFGTPHDVTLQELAVESFFAADDFTAGELARRLPRPA